MRRFPLRRFLVIAIVLALSVSSLAFQEIDLSLGGVRFQRGGDSVLGLRLGLDLEGGSHLVYEARPAEGESVTSEQMEGVRKTIERRVNAFGVSEPIIQQMGDNRVLVQLPGVGTTTATVKFQQDVSAADLRDAMASLGRSNAVIKGNGERSFSIELPNLRPAEVDEAGIVTRESEKDTIETTLADRFPAVIVSLQFEAAVEIGAIQTALAGLEMADADVQELTDTIFTIALSSLTEEGQLAVLEAFQAELPPVTAFNVQESTSVVSGGVEEAKRLIGQTARLELMERICTNDLQDFTQSCDDPAYHVDSLLGLTGDDLVRAYAGTHPTLGLPVVNLEFSNDGARIFAKHTQEIAGTNNRTAFFLDDELLIAPVANQVITGGRAFIQGPDFTLDRVRTIAIQLESGRLQVPLTLIQEQEVDATLGEDSLKKSVVAGLIGLALVLVFMAVYYRLPGLMACLALILYGVTVLAILKLWPITLSLGGIAAFILSIGMAVDANILIFERMKEELRGGRTLIAATETGFNRAWPAIRDSNVATFITCAILFWFGSRLGTGLVTGFAITLFIGVAVSMFSALTVTRALLRAIVITPLGRYVFLYTPVGKAPAATRTGSALGERR